MGRILISNLAPLGEPDLVFFTSLIDSLEALGQSCFFWSGPYSRQFSKYYIPMDWNIGNWPEHLLFDEEDLRNGLEYVCEPEKWCTRISLLTKQGEEVLKPETLFEIIVASSYRLLSEIKPDLFLVWNNLCPHGGIGQEIANGMGIPTRLLERGNFPNTWFLEKGGLVGHSILAGVPLEDLVKPWEYEGFEIVGRNFLKSWGKDAPLKYEQKSIGSRESKVLNQSLPGKKIVFFPPDDISLGFLPAEHEDRKKHLPGFANSYEAALALAKQSDGITVFKPHPSFGDWELPSVEADNFYVMNVDYRELVEWADIVATSGSGLQFYALSRGQPVISMARDLVTGKGIVYEALFEKDISQALRNLEIENESASREKNLLVFLGFLLTRYLISNPGTPDCFRKAPNAAEALVAEIGSSQEPVLRFEESLALRQNLVSPELIRKFLG